MDATRSIFDAIRAGDAAVVEDLLEAEPGLLATRENDVSPLLTALYHRKAEVAALLLARGPDLDVFEAAAVGDVVRLRDLLEANTALAGEYSADGWTALHLACFFGHEPAATLLLETGADVNARSRNAMDNSPLHAAFAGPLSVDGIRALLDAGADVNARQHGGYTALHSAALHGAMDRIELLLSGGADRSMATEDGRTAADLAREKGHDAAVRRVTENA